MERNYDEEFFGQTKQVLANEFKWVKTWIKTLNKYCFSKFYGFLLLL